MLTLTVLTTETNNMKHLRLPQDATQIVLTESLLGVIPKSM